MDLQKMRGRKALATRTTENKDDVPSAPPLYREAIINMMEWRYCAHPSTPGSSPPDAKLIKKWAVQRMYDFCTKHELPEVWAYL